MKVFSYRVKHDLGLAPNPFGGYCTLAVCKPKIRNSTTLKIGDWVVGTGSVAIGNDRILIYIMQVEEKITYQTYWDDPRFMLKKPKIPGSLVQMHGDNFYHQDPVTGNWIQEHSAHSRSSNRVNAKHQKRDLAGKYVLISQRFYYFGDLKLRIPPHLVGIRHSGIGHCSFKGNNPIAEGLISWVVNSYAPGIHGDPINWFANQQLSLF